MRPDLADETLPSPLVLPAAPDLLPTRDVRDFVVSFARAHGVQHFRTGLDDFADVVTQLAGDEVTLDATGNLLVALRRKDVIDNVKLV